MHPQQKIDRKEKFQKVIIYGESGTGKSLMAMLLAQKYKLLYMDLENGSDVVELVNPDWWDNINLVTIQDTPKKPNALEAMLYFWDDEPGYVCWDHGKWKCPKCLRSENKTDLRLSEVEKDTVVVVDSLSQLNTSTNNHIANKMNYKLFEGDKFEWDDWGKNGQIMARILTGIQSARCHVIVISHEAEIEQNDGKKKLTPIGGTTNFSRGVPKYFSHVIRTSNFGGQLIAASSVSDAKKFIAKSRGNVDMSKKGTSLMDIIDGKVEPIDWGAAEKDVKEAVSASTEKKVAKNFIKSKTFTAKK